ncbi:MAG: alpha/beta fold hydrolase, partial [Chloroflexota bacterium]
MNKSKLFSILGLIALLMMSISVSAQESDRTDAYEDAPCPVDIPAGFMAGNGVLGVECGFVTVPESRAEPDGRQIRLAVAVINSASPNPAPDPLLFAQGGPGGSTIDLFLPAAPLFLPFLNQRDIVLVEQRGTLYSEPNLNCTELTDLAIEFIADFNSDEYEAAEDVAYGECFDRVTADGTNLSNFNSVENAADMVDAADALGYTGELNFYGVSYGTLLGQHLLRDHEERIRSIIFDAVAPTNLNFLPDVISTAQNANDVLFDACANDAFCSTQYPDLETLLFDTVADLNENPATISIIDPETDIEYETLFYGDSLLAMIRQLQYTTEFVPSLPYFIQASSEGDFAWAERIGGLVFIDAGRSIADAMYISVMCAEDGDYTADDVNIEGVRDELVELYSV